jgi:hypothetical protein
MHRSRGADLAPAEPIQIFHRLKTVKKFPFLPAFGNRRFRLQPNATGFFAIVNLSLIMMKRTGSSRMIRM